MSVRASEHIAAATSVAAATSLVDPPEEKATAADGKAGASNPVVAGAATANKEAWGVAGGVGNAMNATRGRAEKAEGALRRQGGRLVRNLTGRPRVFRMFWQSGVSTHSTIMTKGSGVYRSQVFRNALSEINEEELGKKWAWGIYKFLYEVDR